MRRSQCKRKSKNEREQTEYTRNYHSRRQLGFRVRLPTPPSAEPDPNSNATKIASAVPTNSAGRRMAVIDNRCLQLKAHCTENIRESLRFFRKTTGRRGINRCGLPNAV